MAFDKMTYRAVRTILKKDLDQCTETNACFGGLAGAYKGQVFERDKRHVCIVSISQALLLILI